MKTNAKVLNIHVILIAHLCMKGQKVAAVELEHRGCG
jgi:hypothetical protein